MRKEGGVEDELESDYLSFDCGRIDLKVYVWLYSIFKNEY
jgi:hypothetical protein